MIDDPAMDIMCGSTARANIGETGWSAAHTHTAHPTAACKRQGRQAGNSAGTQAVQDAHSTHIHHYYIQLSGRMWSEGAP